jgi:predicted lipoprotein with Yx(FWY)xxD motif
VRHSFFSAGAVIAVLTLAACGGGSSGGSGGSSGGGTPPTSAPTTAPVGPASMPQLATVAGAQAYVSSSNQHTLYTFAADRANVSNCTASSGCTGIWPPYAAPAGTVAPSGSGFGIITRSDGTLQWTYQSIPLYNYSGDSSAGQDNGQGLNTFGGVWGTARPAAASTPGPTSSPSGCVGYYC